MTDTDDKKRTSAPAVVSANMSASFTIFGSFLSLFSGRLIGPPQPKTITPTPRYYHLPEDTNQVWDIDDLVEISPVEVSMSFASSTALNSSIPSADSSASASLASASSVVSSGGLSRGLTTTAPASIASTSNAPSSSATPLHTPTIVIQNKPPTPVQQLSSVAVSGDLPFMAPILVKAC